MPHEKKKKLFGQLVNNYYLKNKEKRTNVKQSVKEGP
jgi:hypothetical protein